MNNYQEKCLNQEENDDDYSQSGRGYQPRKGGPYYTDRGLNEKTMIADYENPSRKMVPRKNFQNNPYKQPENKWSDNRVYNFSDRNNFNKNVNNNNFKKNKNFNNKKRKENPYNNSNTISEDYFFNTAPNTNFTQNTMSNQNNFQNTLPINSTNPTLNSNPNSNNPNYKGTNQPYISNPNQQNNQPYGNNYTKYSSNEPKPYYKNKENRSDNLRGPGQMTSLYTPNPNSAFNQGPVNPHSNYNKMAFSKAVQNTNKFNPVNKPPLDQNSSVLTVGSTIKTNYNSNEAGEELNNSRSLNESINSGSMKENLPENVNVKQTGYYGSYEGIPSQSGTNPERSFMNDPYMFHKTGHVGKKGQSQQNVQANSFGDPNFTHNYGHGNPNFRPNMNSSVNFNQQNFFVLCDQNLIKQSIPQNININNNIIFPQEQQFPPHKIMPPKQVPFTQPKFYNGGPQFPAMGFPPFPQSHPFSTGVPNTPFFSNPNPGFNGKKNYSNNAHFVKPKVVGSEKNLTFNQGNRDSLPQKQGKVIQKNEGDVEINSLTTKSAIEKYGSNENIQEEKNLKENNSSFSSAADYDEEENSEDFKNSVEKINIMIKINENESQMLTVEWSDNVETVVKDFFEKFNLNGLLLQPVVEKILAARRIVESLMNSEIENFNVFKEAYEYLNYKEKWKNVLESYDEQNRSSPDNQSNENKQFDVNTIVDNI